MLATLHLVSMLAAGSIEGSRILFSMVVGGAIGAAIGNSRGRLGLGLVLGAFLGCIGWIIILVIPKKSSY